MEPDPQIRKAEEDMPNLLAADTTADQVLAKLAGRPILSLLCSNSHRLSYEVLKLAIADIVGNGRDTPRRLRDRWEAFVWVATDYAEWSDTEVQDVLSFEGCCEAMGIDVDGARRTLLWYTGGRSRATSGRTRRKPVIVSATTGEIGASLPPRRRRGRRPAIVRLPILAAAASHGRRTDAQPLACAR